MQAFRFVAAQKPAELREVAVPEPGPGQVLVKIGAAGACHSDLHILEAPPKPGRPGVIRKNSFFHRCCAHAAMFSNPYS